MAVTFPDIQRVALLEIGHPTYFNTPGGGLDLHLFPDTFRIVGDKFVDYLRGLQFPRCGIENTDPVGCDAVVGHIGARHLGTSGHGDVEGQQSRLTLRHILRTLKHVVDT